MHENVQASGLDQFFKVNIHEVDASRVHELMTTLQEDGTATIQDSQGMEVRVHITEEIIKDALMIPIGNQSLLIKNSTQEISDTFM